MAGQDASASGPIDSSFTARQVASSVRHGRRVTAYVEGGEVSGYVYGMDSYRWGVVDSEAVVWLVPKTSRLRISPEDTYTAEPRREELERLVAPFRAFVMKHYFPHVAPPPSTATAQG